MKQHFGPTIVVTFTEFKTIFQELKQELDLQHVIEKVVVVNQNKVVSKNYVMFVSWYAWSQRHSWDSAQSSCLSVFPAAVATVSISTTFSVQAFYSPRTLSTRESFLHIIVVQHIDFQEPELSYPQRRMQSYIWLVVYLITSLRYCAYYNCDLF